MAEILTGLPDVQNYLNDLSVYGKTTAVHGHDLRAQGTRTAAQ